jgi:methionyl aminopeptidase
MDRITETGAEILTRPPPSSSKNKKKKKKSAAAKENGNATGTSTPEVQAGENSLDATE